MEQTYNALVAMSDETNVFDVWVALLSQSGLILIALVVGALGLLYRRPIVDHLLPKMSSISVMGIELAFEAREAMNRAIDLAEKDRRWPVVIPPEDRDRVIKRAMAAEARLQTVRLLWVDDAPTNNRNELQMLQRLGIGVVPAARTEEALAVLSPDPAAFDVIVSDMHRREDGEDRPTAGLEFLTKYLALSGRKVPVIFYLGHYVAERGIPDGAFGLTNRPDKLLDLIIDGVGGPAKS